MKTFLVAYCTSILAWTTVLGDAREDVLTAARKLNDASGYGWTATTEIEGGQFTPAPIQGKVEKAGFAVLTQERDGNTTIAVLKGEKGVVKTDAGWQTADEFRASQGGGGGGGRGGMRAGALLRSRPPAEEAARLAERVKELKDSAGVISGELTEAAAKELASFGRRGGQAPEPKNSKGNVRFWIKDGALTRMDVRISSTISIQGEERDMTRTTRYDLKDVGSVKVEVPEEARKKLGL